MGHFLCCASHCLNWLGIRILKVSPKSSRRYWQITGRTLFLIYSNFLHLSNCGAQNCLFLAFLLSETGRISRAWVCCHPEIRLAINHILTDSWEMIPDDGLFDSLLHLSLRSIWKRLLHDTIGGKQCCFSIRHVLQVREDCPGDLEKWYRHISKGAWPFSTRDHGWPIADCSSEGLKVDVTAEHVNFGSWELYHFDWSASCDSRHIAIRLYQLKTSQSNSVLLANWESCFISDY